MNLDHIRRKLAFGLPPLTLDECRHLFALATGEQVTSRKRCWCCQGSAVLELRAARPGMCAIAMPCPACSGSGYAG
jgi:DnaJ-class molecular chaperone